MMVVFAVEVNKHNNCTLFTELLSSMLQLTVSILMTVLQMLSLILKTALTLQN